MNIWRVEEFSRNTRVTKRRAVERELEILGEAANKLLKINPTFPLTHARIMVDLRNRVIHVYDSIDETEVNHLLLQ